MTPGAIFPAGNNFRLVVLERVSFNTSVSNICTAPKHACLVTVVDCHC